MKYSLKNDYSETCHPRLLEALGKIGVEQVGGYGEDPYSAEARELIKTRIEDPEAGVFFVSGGTQANLLVVASFLRPHESVICANTGHINVHEAGAIEATGHKIHSIASPDGKLKVQDILAVLEEHTNVPHMVKPRLVYISNSTELGTVYQKEELSELSRFCRGKDLCLFLDGARLGNALVAEDGTGALKLSDLPRFCDAFTIGGTKNGALCGETIVLSHPELVKEFPYLVKQRGALLAKGWILGVQFRELFRGELYFELARHANQAALRIATAFREKGIPFLTEPKTNQIFPILSENTIEKLMHHYEFYRWARIDQEHWAVRLVTSWATPEKVVNEFIQLFLSINTD